LEHRYLKILLTLSVALLALFYAANNIANFKTAMGAVWYVLSQQDHSLYPNSIVPAITSPPVLIAVLILILASEIAAGSLALLGAWHLWRARKADMAGFRAAKRFAILGSGAVALVWFLLFAVFGGALYQMWQTEPGSNSLQGAFQFTTMSMLVLIYLSSAEPERQTD